VSDVEELGADVDELDAEGGAVITADREASDDTELEAVAELVYEEELVLVAVALITLEPEAVRLRTLVPEAVAVTGERAEIDAEGLLVQRLW
jgi:hypothetical protein